jgi:hypothetical protein
MRPTGLVVASAIVALLQLGCRRAETRAPERGSERRGLGSGLTPPAPGVGEPPALGNGPESRAPPSEAQGGPLGAVFACYREARDQTRLENASITELCEGASDASPVACFNDARTRTFLSTPDVISLCRCATSTAPVECFVEGDHTTTLARDEILALCTPSTRLRLAPDCSPMR